MIRRPPRSTRADTLVPYTTLFRSQARLDADAVADLPTGLAEQREAGVLQILGVDRGQPIEHRWIVRQGIRRVDRPVARCRAVAFRALRVDPLLKGETAEHEVEALAADRKSTRLNSSH